MMTSIPETTTYAAELYCVFCQSDLPRINTTQDHSVESVLELDVIGLANLNLDSCPTQQVHFFRTNISGFERSGSEISGPSLSFFDLLRGLPLILTHPKGDVRKIRADTTVERRYEGNVNRPLLFAHVDCWKVARTLDSSLSSQGAYRFMRQLHHILPRACQAKKKPWHLASFSHHYADGNFGSLLSRCATLPPELQARICRYIPPNSLIFRLLTTVQTMSLSSESIPTAVTPIYSCHPLIPNDFTGVGWLHVAFILIFGRTYIRRIHFSNNQSDPRALKVDITKISHFNFAVESLGISAIQVVCDNGDESDWFGSSERGWHGSTRGFHISDIRVLQDDFKLLNLSPLTIANGNGIQRPPRTLWDICPDQSFGRKQQIAHLQSRPKELTHHQCWRLCQYLPFQDKGRPATGITVYNDFCGINQIIVHGPNFEHKVAASNKGFPRYFHLNKGYRIVQLGLLRVGNSELNFGPFLLIQIEVKRESESHIRTYRTAFFGPMTALQHPKAEWLSLIPAQGDEVTGLVFEHLASRELLLTTIGAHTIPQKKIHIEETEKQVLTNNQPFQMTFDVVQTDDQRGYQTTAKLFNVKRLSVQKMSIRNSTILRCTGLCIYYMDGSIATLGQWDGSSTVDSEVIYDARRNGSLEALTFQYGQERKTKDRIVDIIVHTSLNVGIAENPEERKLQCGQTFHCPVLEQKDICWLFTAHGDSVGYYEIEQIQFQPT